uniref:Receptor L-domain domain-containing protein n=1 Tax=Arcella intermedia TaxID=1963864 RepID=A0A6B2LP46_9EUKA
MILSELLIIKSNVTITGSLSLFNGPFTLSSVHLFIKGNMNLINNSITLDLNSQVTLIGTLNLINSSLTVIYNTNNLLEGEIPQ